MSETPPAILAEALTKRYRAKDSVAVDSLDLRIDSGEIFGLLGPNGAGKSTTIAMLCALLGPTSGRAVVAGCDVLDPAVRPELRRRIGIMRAETNPYPHLTAREYLEWSGNLHGIAPAESRRRAEDLLALLDLSAAGDRRIGEYSQGMRRKTALAGALIHAPRVLFLDEALNGVDLPSANAITGLLRRLAAKGVTVMFASHVLETVERLCDRLAILDKGRIVAQGTAEELRELTGAETLEDAFVRLTLHGPVNAPYKGR